MNTYDEHFMSRALELALGGSGYTSPNPIVGAVLVSHGRIIGEGFHRQSGDKHAEVEAIDAAYEAGHGGEVGGSTLYCTLEPCCDAIPGKRTPACSTRIVSEGVARVVISTLDPNPFVSGTGKAEMEEGGVQVDVGPLAGPATLANEAYLRFIGSGRPFVHVKVAQTLDGRIASADGKPAWVTGFEARREVHALRAETDAVLVGSGTARTDNPQLSVRHVTGRQPLRIVLDSSLRLPRDLRLFTDEHADRTILCAASDMRNDFAAEERIVELSEQGVEVLFVDRNSEGGLDLDMLMQELGNRKISSVLVEGGQALTTGMLAAGTWDKLSVYIAAKILGRGIDAVGNLGTERLSEALRLEGSAARLVGADVAISGYRSIEETFGMLSDHARAELEAAQERSAGRELEYRRPGEVLGTSSEEVAAKLKLPCGLVG